MWSKRFGQVDKVSAVAASLAQQKDVRNLALKDDLAKLNGQDFRLKVKHFAQISQIVVDTNNKRSQEVDDKTLELRTLLEELEQAEKFKDFTSQLLNTPFSSRQTDVLHKEYEELVQIVKSQLGLEDTNITDIAPAIWKPGVRDMTINETEEELMNDMNHPQGYTHEDLFRRIRQLSGQLSKSERIAQTAQSQYQKERDQAKEELATLRERDARREEEINHLRALPPIPDTSGTTQWLQSQVDERNVTIRRLEEEVEKQRRHAVKETRRADAAVQRAQTAEAEPENAQEQLREAQAKVEKLQRKVGNLERQVETFENEAAGYQTLFDVNDQLDDAQIEIEKLKTKNKTAAERHAKVVEELNLKLAQHKEALKRRNAALNQLESDKAKLATDRDAAATDAENMEKERDEIRTSKADLQQELQKAREHNEAIQDQLLSANNATTNAIDKLESERQDRRDERQAKDREREKERIKAQNLAEELAGVNSKIKTLTETNEALKKRLNDANSTKSSEVRRLNEQLDKLGKEKSDLQEQFDASERAAENSISDLKQQMEEQRESLQEKIDDLQDSLHFNAQGAENLQEEKDDVQGQLDDARRALTACTNLLNGSVTPSAQDIQCLALHLVRVDLYEGLDVYQDADAMDHEYNTLDISTTYLADRFLTPDRPATVLELFTWFCQGHVVSDHYQDLAIIQKVWFMPRFQAFDEATNTILILIGGYLDNCLARAYDLKLGLRLVMLTSLVWQLEFLLPLNKMHKIIEKQSDRVLNLMLLGEQNFLQFVMVARLCENQQLWQDLPKGYDATRGVRGRFYRTLRSWISFVPKDSSFADALAHPDLADLRKDMGVWVHQETDPTLGWTATIVWDFAETSWLLNTKVIFLTKKDGSVELNPRFYLEADRNDIARITLRFQMGTTGIEIQHGSMLKDWLYAVLGDELSEAEDRALEGSLLVVEDLDDEDVVFLSRKTAEDFLVEPKVEADIEMKEEDDD